MDDRTGTTDAARFVLAALALLLAALAARAVLGDLGVQVVLVVTMVGVAALAWSSLTGRALSGTALFGGGAPAPALVVEDVWRSERWIAEAVERGLRALDDYRREQRGA